MSGAWSYGYLRPGWKPVDARSAKLLADVKQALIDNGFGANIVLSAQVFGDAATNDAKKFQQVKGLVADGVVGPTTARFLWRFYASPAEIQYGIPEHWLGKIATGESANDPVAEGVADPDDEGLLQWHMPYWPGATLDQAWTPSYALHRSAEKLASYQTATGSWKGAVAAWNIGPTYAAQWVKAGYPATGGPQMGVDERGNPIYAFTRATEYVAYVAALPY